MQTGAGPTGLAPGERVQGHPAVRTLLLSRGELSAWLLDQRTDATQQLNESAAAVWALLDRPCTVDELTADLAEMTGLEPAPAREIVVAAIDTFREAELLDDGGAASGDATGDSPTGDSPAGDDLAGDRSTGGRSTGDRSTGGASSVDLSAEVEVPQRLARPPDP